MLPGGRPAWRRSWIAALLSVATVSGAACSIDALLEAKVPPNVELSISVQSTEVPANPGTDVTLDASITRLGDFHGAVVFAITGLPESIKGEIGSTTTTGQVTSTTLTFRVGASVAPGEYLATIRGTGGSNGVTATQVVIKVTALAGVAMALSTPALTIIRGGVAPLSATLVRTSAPNPVTLALVGNAGITAVFATNPVTGTSAGLTVNVAASVAPGTYAMTLRGTSPGIPDCSVPLPVIVSNDPLQLIADNVSALQASVATAGIIVNRNGISGDVTLSMTGLPAGVTAVFQNVGSAPANATLTVTVAASAPTGSYSATLHARGDGGAEASTLIGLAIGASNVAMTVAPQFVTVLQGLSSASTLTLQRTSYAGPVAMQVLGAPPGLLATVADATVTGTTTFLTVSADPALRPGAYPLTVRAVPAPYGGSGTLVLDPVNITVTVTVVEAPPGSGNVILDWSACAPPAWVAGQDGSGPWTQVFGAQGRYRFAITSGRGGYAYTEGNKQIVVRFGTASELTTETINLCPTVDPPTHDVTGAAVHSGLQELFTWRLGGGVGSSTQLRPNFTITGVRDGAHDLVGWGTSAVYGLRMHLTRDVNALPGESVGQVGLIGINAFTPVNTQVTLGGFNNEPGGYLVSYLTGASCDVNALYQGVLPTTNGISVATIYGVPPASQRVTDYHLIDLSGGSGVTHRIMSVSFHSLAPGRVVSLPIAISPTVVPIAGSHRRLRLFFAQSIAASYNGIVTLNFSDDVHSVTMSASVAVLGSGTPILDMPDFGSVTGFPASAVMPTDATGGWTLSVTGSSGQPLCSDESRRWSFTRNGVF